MVAKSRKKLSKAKDAVYQRDNRRHNKKKERDKIVTRLANQIIKATQNMHREANVLIDIKDAIPLNYQIGDHRFRIIKNEIFPSPERGAKIQGNKTYECTMHKSNDAGQYKILFHSST